MKQKTILKDHIRNLRLQALIAAILRLLGLGLTLAAAYHFGGAWLLALAIGIWLIIPSSLLDRK